MIRPTLSEAKEYAKQGYHMVPVCYEMLSDIITPINLLKKLKAENEHCYIGKRGESGVLGKIHFPWIQSKTGYHLYERNTDIKG